MRLGKRILIGLCGLALSLGAGAVPAEIVVVVSAQSQIGVLSKEEVADIFLGKAVRFPGGERAVPIDQIEGSAARDEFYTRVAGKTAAQIKAYWSKLIFTGRGQPPEEAADSAEVKKLVTGNRNAIGYIDPAAVDDTVKVLHAP